MEKTIIVQAIRSGRPIPDKIQNAPRLWMGLEIYYDGFMRLINSRSIGMSLGHIHWSTIQDFCEKTGLDEDTTFAMHTHITALDTTYVTHHSKS